MREKLFEILRVPIYPHELADPTEVVADYLLDNDVVPVVRCKDCYMFCPEEIRKLYNTEKYCMRTGWVVKDDDFCSHGERRTDEV